MEQKIDEWAYCQTIGDIFVEYVNIYSLPFFSSHIQAGTLKIYSTYMDTFESFHNLHHSLLDSSKKYKSIIEVI